MAHLKLTLAQAATLITLRSLPSTDAGRKDAKKGVFDAIRSAFGIPADVKLKVEIDDRASPDYLVLKDKTSGHKLLANALGKYAGRDIPPVTVPVAPGSTVPAAQTAGRFSVSSSGVKVINKATLMCLLADAFDDGDASVAAGVPAGMPSVPIGGLVLDNQTGDLYFN